MSTSDYGQSYERLKNESPPPRGGPEETDVRTVPAWGRIPLKQCAVVLTGRAASKGVSFQKTVTTLWKCHIFGPLLLTTLLNFAFGGCPKHSDKNWAPSNYFLLLLL